jgi:hypothetical protein
MRNFKQEKILKGLLTLLTTSWSLIFMAGCSSTFLVSKDGKSYFFGRNTSELHKILCESGDLIKILEDTRFKDEIRGSLYKYNCTPEYSADKVKEIYASLTGEQRKELRVAFKRHGYDINYLPC